MPTPKAFKRMPVRVKPIVVTIGPNGEINLPTDVLRHVGLPAGGVVSARKRPGKSIVIRRTKRTA